jgi:hypothetical protein
VTISESFREKLCKKKRESVRDDNFESGRDGEIESAEQRQSQKIVGWYSPKLLSQCWMFIQKFDLKFVLR